MNPEEVLRLLEKHEKECHVRYSKIEKSLDKLDVRLWAIVVLIIIASGFEQLL